MNYELFDSASNLYLNASYLCSKGTLNRDYYKVKVFDGKNLIWEAGDYSPSPMTGFQDPESFGEVLSFMCYYYDEKELPSVAMEWMDRNYQEVSILSSILEEGEEE